MNRQRQRLWRYSGLLPISRQLSELKAATDERIRRSLNLQVNRDQNFLDELARFLGSHRGWW